MSTSLTARLVRLADHLGDLRVRLQEAARCEVAHAVAEALSDATRCLISGRSVVPSRSIAPHESSPWDDPWSEADQADREWEENAESADRKPFPYEAAL